MVPEEVKDRVALLEQKLETSSSSIDLVWKYVNSKTNGHYISKSGIKYMHALQVSASQQNIKLQGMIFALLICSKLRK